MTVYYMCWQMMSDLQCKGVASSKKAAKKQAAEKMLDLLAEDGDEYDVVDARVDIIFLFQSFCIRTLGFVIQVSICTF